MQKKVCMIRADQSVLDSYSYYKELYEKYIGGKITFSGFGEEAVLLLVINRMQALYDFLCTEHVKVVDGKFVNVNADTKDINDIRNWLIENQ